MKVIIVIGAWLIGAYFGYTTRPPNVTERHIKVICIPDSDTEAKAGDSVQFKVGDFIEFKRKITEEI